MKLFRVSLFSYEVGRTLYFIGSCYLTLGTLMHQLFWQGLSPYGRQFTQYWWDDLFLIAASGEEVIEKLLWEDQTEVDIEGEWIANGQWAAFQDGTILVVSSVNPTYS